MIWLNLVLLNPSSKWLWHPKLLFLCQNRSWWNQLASLEDTLARNYSLTESECKRVCELYFDDSWIFAMLCPASLHNIFKDEMVQKATKNKTEEWKSGNIKLVLHKNPTLWYIVNCCEKNGKICGAVSNVSFCNFL